MSEQSNYEKIEYNGKMHALSAIAKLEEINPDSLRKRYNKTHDIYEAVKLTKEAKLAQEQRISQISYKGQILSIRAIAQLEGINQISLRNRYKETQDIYRAVELTKKGKIEKEETTTLLPYKGQILSITAIAKLEGISKKSLKNRYVETKDINEAVKLTKEAQEKEKERINQIPYKGQILSIRAIAKLEGITADTLGKRYKETQDIYEAINLAKRGKVNDVSYNGKFFSNTAIAKLEGIHPHTLKSKYAEAKDINEAVKLAKESQKKEQERISKILYNGQTLSISAIAKLEGIRTESLRERYDATKDIYEAIKLTKEKQITKIPYNGQILSMRAIAEKENIVAQTLKAKFEKTQDIDKAVMLCKLIKTRTEKRKEIVQTKEFGNLTYYDLSLIIGIKYSELQKLLEQGNTIDDIIELKEKVSKNNTGREIIKLDNGQSLAEFCIENKLNYRCIYRAMKIYGKTLSEAVNTYNSQGQQTPAKWIYEKYGLLLKHLMLKESIDINRVVSYMRKDYLPMEQAVEKFIIRSNSKKDNLDNDWMEELYDVLSDDSISKEDYDDYLLTFYVDEKEENCIKRSKEQFNNIKRKLLLFELSSVLREGIFTPEEEKRLFEEYNITEDEVDIIFNELYERFTDPGVLMGKNQQEVITPEQEKSRNEKINKYKQMVREIKENNNIVFMMRFMVGPNVGTNEECRNEIHKELQKETKKENKQVDLKQ